MAIVEHGGWSMVVPQEVADNPEERAKVVALLMMIIRVEDIEKAYELTLTSTSS